jgi:hypothetical protein
MKCAEVFDQNYNYIFLRAGYMFQQGNLASVTLALIR